MKFTKILGMAAVAALALMAFASTASATTLEIGGSPTLNSVTIESTIKSGTSALLTDTAGFFANTCTSSTVNGATTATAKSGSRVSGPISSLTFSSCTEEPVVVHNAGTLTVEHIAGTTNGTVRSIGAFVTSPSPFGLLECRTAEGEGTDIGTLTGVASTTEHATMDINAGLNCGAITAKWKGTYTVTSPTGLGVTS
ncbi:MAG TPA: hypothetical protein VFN85_01165 [Solirubrobacterales bacterium]|nr:hypothetical protein [Solirubrobacterales bacterium]